MNKLIVTTLVVAAAGCSFGCNAWRDWNDRRIARAEDRAAERAAKRAEEQSYRDAERRYYAVHPYDVETDDVFNEAYGQNDVRKYHAVYGSSPRSYDVYRTEPTVTTYQSAATATTADTRILSIMHAVDREEIEMGSLARERGTTHQIREYGARLERDHASHDARVVATADAAGIELMDSYEVRQMYARERGSQYSQDPIAELQNLSGREFDETFANKMYDGHRRMITVLEDARGGVSNANVRRLIDETLPKLREHEQAALDLVNAYR